MVSANPSSAAAEEPVVGIDLGTENSCIGLVDAQTGEVQIIPNALKELTTPSRVGFSE